MIGFRARQGDYSAVEKWLVERGLEHAPNSLPPAYSENSFTAKVYKYELPIVIRFLTHKERFEEAQQAIKELLALADQASRPFLVLEALILESVLQRAWAHFEKSRQALIQALELAAPMHAARLFILEREVLNPILRDIQPSLESREVSLFVSTLLASDEPQIDSPKSVGMEALSPRELDILRLLPTELTAEELADELVISVNTVRTHMKNIYAKLKVHSRHKAVDKARTENLI
jgi:LuxR family maltose regulon positive regulatory protein